MPQTHGPVVVPGSRNTGILAGVLGNFAQPLAQAAGGFLSDMFYNDPNKELIRAQAGMIDRERQQKEQDDYEKWLANHGKNHDIDTFKAWARSRGKDEEWAEQALEGYAPTVTTEMRIGHNQGTLAQRDIISGEGPFTVGSGVISEQPVPGQGSTAEPVFALPATADALTAGNPVPGTILGPGIDQSTTPDTASPVVGAPASGAAAQAAASALAAQPTGQVEKPPMPGPVEPVAAPPAEPDVPAPQPVPVDRLKQLQLRNQKYLGLLAQAQMAQLDLANADPAKVAAVRDFSQSLMTASLNDLDEFTRMGRLAQGMTPDPNKNYGELAVLAKAYADAQNVEGLIALEVSGPDGAALAKTIRENARRFEQKMYTLTPSDLQWVAKTIKLLPPLNNGGAVLQHELGHRYARNQAEAAKMENAIKEKHLLIEQQNANDRTAMTRAQIGLTQEQIRGMGLENDFKNLVQGERVSAYQAEVEMLRKKLGWAEGDHRIDNLAKITAIQSHQFNNVFRMAGMTNQNRAYITALSTQLQGVRTNLANMEKAWLDSLNASQVTVKLNSLSKLPADKLNQMYENEKKKDAKVAEYEAKTVIGGGLPTNAQKVEILTQVAFPDYAAYSQRRATVMADMEMYTNEWKRAIEHDNMYKGLFQQHLGAQKGNKATAADLALRDFMVSAVQSNAAAVKNYLSRADVGSSVALLKSHPALVDYALDGITMDNKGMPTPNGNTFTAGEFDGNEEVSHNINVAIYATAMGTKQTGAVLSEGAFLNSAYGNSRLGAELGTPERKRKAYQMYLRLRGK